MADRGYDGYNKLPHCVNGPYGGMTGCNKVMKTGSGVRVVGTKYITVDKGWGGGDKRWLRVASSPQYVKQLRIQTVVWRHRPGAVGLRTERQEQSATTVIQSQASLNF